jgi:hypothetical protein
LGPAVTRTQKECGDFRPIFERKLRIVKGPSKPIHIDF